jgi:hypothetical protein
MFSDAQKVCDCPYKRDFHNCSTYTNEIWYGKESLTYLQVVFESLCCLTKFLNMAFVWHFEVMLAQMLNHSVYNSQILSSVISYLNYLTCC